MQELVKDDEEKKHILEQHRIAQEEKKKCLNNQGGKIEPTQPNFDNNTKGFFMILKEFSGRKGKYKNFKFPVGKVITGYTIKHTWGGFLHIKKLINGGFIEEVKDYKEEDLLVMDDINKEIQGSAEEEEEKTQKSFIETKDLLVEQCYEEGKGVSFAIWDGNEVKYQKSVVIDGVEYSPIVAEEVTKKALLLPSKAEEYGTDEELDKEITEYIHKWLDIPDEKIMYALWNIKRSWVYERFHTLNYLRALGDTGTGKTRYLDTLGYIHYKPLATSGATTSAPVFRIIEKWRGTLIMDEADFSKSDEAQDIIKIINVGYERGKHVLRCDQNDAKKIDLFDPFCPKILATRKSFTDKATESRCSTTVMLETTRQDIPPNLNDEFFETTQKLRNKLLMWRFRNYRKIDLTKKIDLGVEVEPRIKQIVNSYGSLFVNEKQVQEFKNFVMEQQEEIIEERRNTFVGEVVEGIHRLLGKGVVDISAQDIIEEMGLTDYKGNPLKPRGLSATLKGLGFGKGGLKWIGETAKRCLPLDKNTLKSLFKRYGLNLTNLTNLTVENVPNLTNLTVLTVVGGTGKTVRIKENVPKPPKPNGFKGSPLESLGPLGPLEQNITKLDTVMYVRCNICKNTSVEGCKYELNGQLICDDCARQKQEG